MNSEVLSFVTFCVGNLADALNMSASEVYSRLRTSHILTDYIIPSYDVLHTFSKEYIIEDLIGLMQERGVLEKTLKEDFHHAG